MNNLLPPEEERFSKNILGLAEIIRIGIEELYEKGYDVIDPNIILFYTSILTTLDKHLLITKFIEHSHETCWDKIKDRDEIFFIENASSIFSYLPTENINLFKDLFTTVDENQNCVITQEFKNNIWCFFDSMIKISIKYIYKNPNKFENISVNNHIQKWELKL